MNKYERHDLEAKAANYERCYGFPHVIKKGDTLYKLSRQYHVKVSALILANPYVNIYNMQVGDTICIPRIRPVVVPVPLYPPTRPWPPSMNPDVPASPGGEENLPPMIPDVPASPGGEENLPPMTPDVPASPGGEETLPPMTPDVPASPGGEENLPPMTPDVPAIPGGEENLPPMNPDAPAGVPDWTTVPENGGSIPDLPSDWPDMSASVRSTVESAPQVRMVRPEITAVPGNEDAASSSDIPDIPVKPVQNTHTSLDSDCTGIQERLDTMTVRELLEEWDLTYPMLMSCLDIIKKL